MNYPRKPGSFGIIQADLPKTGTRAEASWTMLWGLVFVHETAEAESVSRRSGPREPSAEDVAYRMAEIYVLGMGKVPEGHARSTDGEPTWGA